MAKARGKADTTAAVTEVLARHGFPSAGGKGLAFTPQGDALYAAGYPHMRLLSDEPVPEHKAVKIAEDALDAIDPVFRITMPRSVARAFLAGYRGGTGLFLDDAYKPQNASLNEQRAAMMRAEVTIELLRDTLAERGVSMLDTYARWRWPKVIYLYEAFLGTEPVARALTTHLVREANDLSRWGFAGQDPHRTNATPHYLALALSWLFVRLPPPVVQELRAELLSARAPSDTPGEPRAYLSLLRALGGDAAADRAPFAFELGLAENDAAAIQPMADVGHNFLWYVGRLSWTLGTARLAQPLNVSGHDLPRMIDQIAPLRDPGIARLVAAIAASARARRRRQSGCDATQPTRVHPARSVDARGSEGEEDRGGRARAPGRRDARCGEDAHAGGGGAGRSPHLPRAPQEAPEDEGLRRSRRRTSETRTSATRRHARQAAIPSRRPTSRTASATSTAASGPCSPWMRSTERGSNWHTKRVALRSRQARMHQKIPRIVAGVRRHCDCTGGGNELFLLSWHRLHLPRARALWLLQHLGLRRPGHRHARRAPQPPRP